MRGPQTRDSRDAWPCTPNPAPHEHGTEVTQNDRFRPGGASDLTFPRDHKPYIRPSGVSVPCVSSERNATSNGRSLSPGPARPVHIETDMDMVNGPPDPDQSPLPPPLPAEPCAPPPPLLPAGSCAPPLPFQPSPAAQSRQQTARRWSHRSAEVNQQSPET